MVRSPRIADPLLLLLALAGLGGCRAIPRTKTVDDQVVAARELTRQGMASMVKSRWDEAEKKLWQAVRACPQDCTARQHYAEVLWHQGERAEALEQLTQAIKMSDGVTADSYVRLGEMHLALHQPAAAARYADQALRADISSPRAWQLWGQLLAEEKRWDESLSAYQRVLSLEPENMTARLAMANIYLQQQRPQRALATVDAVAANRPLNDLPSEWWKLKGAALLAMQQPARAQETLQLALETLEPDAALYRQMASVCLANEQVQQASWALEQARELAPEESPEELAMLGQKLQELRLAAESNAEIVVR